jgi:hypothetical protein
MAMSTSAMMRSGLVSAKAAAKFKPAILNETRVQKSKMLPFDGKGRAEGKVKDRGVLATRGHINSSATQRDRVGSMPSKHAGGGGFGAATKGSKSPQGGAVGRYSQVNRKQIDTAEMQAPRFPAGTGTDHPRSNKTGNTRMKGPIAKSGAAYGGGGQNTQ